VDISEFQAELGPLIPIQSHITMHHYGCVALYEASILQKGRF